MSERIGDLEDRSVTCHCCGEDVDEREAVRFTESAGYVCPGCVDQIRQIVGEAQHVIKDFASDYDVEIPRPRSRYLIRQLACMVVQERGSDVCEGIPITVDDILDLVEDGYDYSASEVEYLGKHLPAINRMYVEALVESECRGYMVETLDKFIAEERAEADSD